MLQSMLKEVSRDFEVTTSQRSGEDFILDVRGKQLHETNHLTDCEKRPHWGKGESEGVDHVSR